MKVPDNYTRKSRSKYTTPDITLRDYIPDDIPSRVSQNQIQKQKKALAKSIESREKIISNAKSGQQGIKSEETPNNLHNNNLGCVKKDERRNDVNTVTYSNMVNSVTSVLCSDSKPEREATNIQPQIPNLDNTSEVSASNCMAFEWKVVKYSKMKRTHNPKVTVH